MIDHSSIFNIYLYICIWRDRFRVVKLGRILPSKVKPLKNKVIYVCLKSKKTKQKKSYLELLT